MSRDIDMAVYIIRNERNGRVYVGGSTQLPRRWKMHRQALARGTGQASLQQDWDAYGADAFTFEIVERVATATALYEAEQRHVSRFQAGGHDLYNRRLTVQDSYGGVYLWQYDRIAQRNTSPGPKGPRKERPE